MPHFEDHQFEELGFYTLAGAPASTRDLIAEVRDGRSARARTLLHLRALQRQGGGDRLRCGRGRERAHRHRHRGDEPPHPSPHDHRRVRADHAQPHRRSLHPRDRSRRRPAVGRDGPAAHHDRADGGLRRPDAPPLGGRGDPRARRPAGSWPYLNLDGIEGLDIPLGLVAFGPNSLKLGGRAFDQIVLHTFFTDETTARVVQDGQGRRRGGRARSRRR